MTLDWSSVTPAASAFGGVLIGLSAALFILFNGRIGGISGVFGGLLKPARRDVAWRVAFRSLVATATFMAAGFVTVFSVRHLLGL